MAIRVYPVVGVRDICAGYGVRGAHLHDACDLCAPIGTPLVAVDDGTVGYGVDPIGGNVAVLHTPSGVAYYYAHLRDAASGSRDVAAGDQLAVVGMTGNAARVGIPHVHFQVWAAGVFAGPHPDPTLDLLAAPMPSAGWTARNTLAALAIVLGGAAAALLARRARVSRLHRVVTRRPLRV